MSIAQIVAARMADELSALSPAESWAAGELLRRSVEADQRRAAAEIGVSLEEFRRHAFGDPSSDAYVGGET